MRSRSTESAAAPAVSPPFWREKMYSEATSVLNGWLPAIRWAVAYGVVLTTARVIGEFGAVSAVAGTKLTLPLYVRAEVENFDTSGAYAASVVLALIAIATVVVLRAFHPREETG